MDTSEAIRRAIHIFAANTTCEIEDVKEALRQNGFSAEMASAVITFMPLAVGRVLLGRMGVKLPDEYIRADAQGRERFRGALLDEPVFRETLALVPEVLAQGEEVVQSIMVRSPEVLAVNQALQSGSRPEDLMAGRPVLGWDEGMPETVGLPRGPNLRWTGGSAEGEANAAFPCPACGGRRESPDADCPRCGWKRMIRLAIPQPPRESPQVEASRPWWSFWKHDWD